MAGLGRFSGLVSLLLSLSAGAAWSAPPVSPHWVGSWASAQVAIEEADGFPAKELAGATLREVVHLSVGGPEVRVRVSNAFGTTPLRLQAAHLARAADPATGAIEPGSDRSLRFGGEAEVSVPPGADYWSDPVALDVEPFSDLAVSLVFASAPEHETGHPGSRAVSFLAPGAHVADATLTAARRAEHWIQLSGVDVSAPEAGSAIVALGDSITDGYGVKAGTNGRWPDLLARRLEGRSGMLNVGVGGGRVLLDGLGPSAMARFDRDVLSQSNVRCLIVMEGVNDLGDIALSKGATAADRQALVRDLTAAFVQMVAQAHAHGLRIVGATITPFVDSDFFHPGPLDEAARQQVDAWIRAPGHFDAVVDFDRLLRDPAHPERLSATYDSGDHLHPSAAGYRAMAEAVPLQACGA